MKTKSIVIALSLYAGVTVAQKLKGSDTVLPLAQKEAESYMKANKSAKITVTGGGSGVGISALLDGTTDIAMSSRKIKMTEKIKLSDAGKSTKETIIAQDALAVVVNPANKVTQLTREQLEDIFTGKVKNWKEVGGDDLTIVVYSRESSSGTYEFFKEHVMKNKNYASSVLSMPATGSIIQSIGQTKGAIGYVGFAYVEKEVRALKVSFDKGKNFVAPSMVTAKGKSYPIIRPLYYYYLSSVEKNVKPFVDYCISAEGQKIVEQVGYIPLSK
ncbi:MAG: phosphate transporter substrate-binding protein [Bacteroidetes bacterium]|nr:phosphate transporter substrate-binding protein [Bacteroidota bacterium]